MVIRLPSQAYSRRRTLARCRNEFKFLQRATENPKDRLAQPWARVEPEECPAADRIPLRSERRRLADHLQVAPHLGQPALGLERGAPAVPEHQVHRLACA